MKLVRCIFLHLLVQIPSSTSNAQSVPVDIISVVVFGICVIFLLLIGLSLIWLLVSKKRRKVCLQAVIEGPEPLSVSEDSENFHEYPNAAYGTSIQLRFFQDNEVRTADNVAYSTRLQALQDQTRE